MCLHEDGVFARFRYNDLKEAARDLRRTRALCKFNGGKVQRAGAPELWDRAPPAILGEEKVAEVQNSR
jgi:hypothetical protein